MELRDQPLQSFIPISDADKATIFYRDVLGLELLEDTPFALVFAVSGGALRLAKTPDFTPQPFTVVGWEVDDIASGIAELARHGVTLLRFDGLPQDEAGVWRTPDGTQVVWFNDPDGNVLSLSQPA